MVGNQHLIFLNLTNKHTRWAARSVAIIKKQKFPWIPVGKPQFLC